MSSTAHSFYIMRNGMDMTEVTYQMFYDQVKGDTATYPTEQHILNKWRSMSNERTTISVVEDGDWRDDDKAKFIRDMLEAMANDEGREACDNCGVGCQQRTECIKDVFLCGDCTETRERYLMDLNR